MNWVRAEICPANVLQSLLVARLQPQGHVKHLDWLDHQALDLYRANQPVLRDHRAIPAARQRLDLNRLRLRIDDLILRHPEGRVGRRLANPVDSRAGRRDDLDHEIGRAFHPDLPQS